MSTTPAGWYPDPSVAGQVRYFDGHGWTEHTQPTPQAIAAPQAAQLPAVPGYDQTPAVAQYQQQPQQYQQPQQQPQQYQQPQPQFNQPQQAQPPQQQFNQAPQQYGQPQATAVNQIMINNVAAVPVGPQKNVGVAILLTFFFGPLGLLYATVSGGLIMILVSILTAPLVILFGIPQLAIWIGCMVWAGVAVTNLNQAAAMGAAVNAGVMTAPQQPAVQQQQPQQYQQQPQAQQQPQQYAPPAALPQQTGAPNPYQQGAPAEQQVPPPR